MEFTKKKGLIVVFIAVLICLQYKFWFERGGYMDMLRLKKTVAMHNDENEKLKSRNQLLATQVQALQNNKSAIESRARSELGMVKKGEVFYQVVAETKE